MKYKELGIINDCPGWTSEDAVRKGFTESSIRKCLSGEFSQHKGYKWYFLKRIKL